ncbi:hypothetical protein G9A89_014558 [Geosiphon pyriformis]|nr:hypothetical protein G9A89_014558 [Geosiphon pyriformis]
MADTSLNFWVNPFQLLRLSDKDEMQRSVEFANKEILGDDGCCESGDKSIYQAFSPLTPGTPTKTKQMSTPTRNNRGHPFNTTTTDNLALSPNSPKGVNNSPTNYLTPEQIADAAAVLAQLATTPSKDTSILNMFNNTPPTKYLVDEKPSKKHLKRSLSFNHSSRPTSPRQQTSSSSAYIDVTEVLATTVSLVRENNRKLDKISDEVRSEGNYSENDNDYWSDEDSWQQEEEDDDDDEGEYEQEDQQVSGWKKGEIENEIQSLSVQLVSMETKYKEQVYGKTLLIQELENALETSEKDSRRKRAEIERLEGQLEASRRAIAELVDQQQRESEIMRNQTLALQTTETVRRLEAELREKNKAISELNKRITVSSRQVSDSKEKEKKLETLTNQLLRYQSLEIEWQGKQATLDGLSSQLETLREREAELNEKDALIQSLNIRLDTSQQVIAELREKHAPHDLLRQLRQKDYIIDNLTQQVENIDADLKEKDDEIEALAGRLAEEGKLMEKLREQNSQLIPLRTRAEEADKKSAQIKQQIADKENLLVDFEIKYREASRTIEDGGEKLRAQEKTISTLRQDVVELRRALTTQSSENREKERLIANTRDETAHIRSNFQGLLNALSEKDQKIQQLDQHIESLQQQTAAALAKSQINNNNNVANAAGVKDSKNKTEVRLNALQKVLNSKIEACRDYEKKITQLEEEFAGLRKQMDESKTVSSEKEIKIQRLVKMNRELKEEVTQLKEKMEEKEKELVTIKSRIPAPAPQNVPAASVRSSASTSRMARSRLSSSFYNLSGGESSGDEVAKTGAHHVRKAASLSGFESPLRRRNIIPSTSRRLSDTSKISSVPSKISPARTKSSTYTSSNGNGAFRKTAALTQLTTKRGVKPHLSIMATTNEVLKKKLPVTPKKEVSPINRSAVTQRKLDMAVMTNLRSGFAPDRKNRLSTIAQKQRAGINLSSSTSVNKKKLTDNTASSDSDGERIKQTTVATVKKIRAGESTSSPVKGTPLRPKATINSPSSISLIKQSASLTRPLPSRKPSSTA